jgi:hypothetical protein
VLSICGIARILADVLFFRWRCWRCGPSAQSASSSGREDVARIDRQARGEAEVGPLGRAGTTAAAVCGVGARCLDGGSESRGSANGDAFDVFYGKRRDPCTGAPHAVRMLGARRAKPRAALTRCTNALGALVPS